MTDCQAPCCLPVLRVYWCFGCQVKRVDPNEWERLEDKPHRKVYEEVICSDDCPGMMALIYPQSRKWRPARAPST